MSSHTNQDTRTFLKLGSPSSEAEALQEAGLGCQGVRRAWREMARIIRLGIAWQKCVSDKVPRTGPEEAHAAHGTWEQQEGWEEVRK